MGRLSDFRKLRRRNDSVKAAILMLALAAYLVIRGAFSIAQYYAFAHGNVEYVVSVGGTGGMSSIGGAGGSGSVGSAGGMGSKGGMGSVNVMGGMGGGSMGGAGGAQKSDLARLGSIEDVICVSERRVYSVACAPQGVILCVTEVSAGYLREAYGIEEPSGHCLWLNAPAWEELSLGESGSHASITYEDIGGAQTVGAILCEALPGEVPTAYCAGTSVSLSGSPQAVVLCGKTDITGGTLGRIRGLGYSVANEGEILEGQYKLDALTVELRYGAIAAALAALNGVYLYKKASKSAQTDQM